MFSRRTSTSSALATLGPVRTGRPRRSGCGASGSAVTTQTVLFSGKGYPPSWPGRGHAALRPGLRPRP